MSTPSEKIQAQSNAIAGRQRKLWVRHLIGPVELEHLLSRATSLDGLKHVAGIIASLRVRNNSFDYNAALHDVETLLNASIERVENGDPMHSVAHTQ